MEDHSAADLIVDQLQQLKELLESGVTLTVISILLPLVVCSVKLKTLLNQTLLCGLETQFLTMLTV